MLCVGLSFAVNEGYECGQQEYLNRTDFEARSNHTEHNSPGGVVRVASKSPPSCRDKEANCTTHEMFLESSSSVWTHTVCWPMKTSSYDGYRFLGDGSLGIENNQCFRFKMCGYIYGWQVNIPRE